MEDGRGSHFDPEVLDEFMGDAPASVPFRERRLDLGLDRRLATQI
jgi:hypothetical protein